MTSSSRITDLIRGGRLVELPSAVRAYRDFAEQSGTTVSLYTQALLQAMLALARGDFNAADERTSLGYSAMVESVSVMRPNCANILKMPGLARFGPHPLGAGLRRCFRTSATLSRQDPDESRPARRPG